MSTLPRTAKATGLESFGNGRFQLKRRLGEGSMGAVYLAYDRERRLDVALKTLRRADAMSIYRFKREFRSLSDVVHPNLVALYDLFHDGDLYYFTMEHVSGRDFLTYVLGASRHAYVETPRSTPDALDALPRDTTSPGLETLGLELLFPTPLRDQDRLRNVLVQIGHALLAIHAAGKLHRDLKSDNVLVTDEGRAKVLDFGIAIERAQPSQGTLELGVMGTPAYMSPEQAAGDAVDEATDWYALGVMLYEALTGSVPFDGGYLEIMHQKQKVDPPPPSQVVSGVPVDLDALCRELLQRNPGARPSGLSVLRALEGKRPPSIRPPRMSSSMPAEPDAPFVGRAEELAALRRHLAETDRGKPVVTLLEGPSGIGKTTLVERFISELRAGERTVVLRGRCYERESVPFKAFDSLIDSLSRHLRRLPAAEAAEVLPREILALAHLFPVLKRVDVVAAARRRTALPKEPKELRARAFGALKELFRRLADRMALVLFIDDLQWGDVDSAQLIRELLRASDPPALHLVLSYRSGEPHGSPCLQTLLAHRRESDDFEMHELALQPLSERESIELAGQLLGTDLPAATHGLGAESQGNPHLLVELVRHVARRKQTGMASGDTSRGIVTFERALMTRVSELSAGARMLLELLSVAGRPVPEENLAFVSSFGIDMQQAVTELRGSKLVRGVGPHAKRAIETYHDRVREVVVAAMEPDRLELWHKRLASTFEATGEGDLEAIVEHLIGAGDGKRAQIYAIRAATQAAEALAFEKAARLFAIAVENQDDQGWGHELLVRWADALVNAGYGRQAAAVYFEASRSSGERDARVFQRKAGLQLLINGYEAEALELLGGTLEQLGGSIPANLAAGAPELAALRARIGERGFAIVRREPSEIALDVIEQTDDLGTLALYLTQSDPDRALPLVARYLMAVLELGEPVRAVRGLCLYHAAIDAPLCGLEGVPLQGALAAAEAIERTFDHPDAHARVQLAHGLDALREGELKPALRALAAAEELLRTRCPGSAPDTRMCHSAMAFLLVAFLQLERLRSIEQWAQDAEEHEDLLCTTRLRLFGTLAALVADAPARAERGIAQAIVRWGLARFDLTALAYCQARALVATYRDDAAACREVVAAYEPFFSSTLSALPMLRCDALLSRARCMLVAAGQDAEPTWLVRVEEDMHAAAALGLPGVALRVRLLEAAIAAKRGDRARALSLLEAVIVDPADVPDRALVHAAACLRKGDLIGGADGQVWITSAEAALRAEGVANPRLFARML